MDIQEIISTRKDKSNQYPFLYFGTIIATVTFVLLAIPFITKFETKSSLAIGIIVVFVLALLLMFSGACFAYSINNSQPSLETIQNIEKAFGLRYRDTIQGDLTSTRDQTIIFTGIKNNEYSNFTAIVKDGIFTLEQHPLSNRIQLKPTR